MELYVHIPFCRKKCRYCAFTSFTGQEAYQEKYIGLILREAQTRKAEIAEPIRTVYIGGGTPSLLSPPLLDDLLKGLNNILGLDAVEEFTTEANPGTITREWLDTAVMHGVNRISFGMQAYQNRLLQLLGRIHRFDDVALSVALARKAGIDNISLDLIFGLPAQTIKDWNETADAALALNPDHLSAYGLIPEEGTPLCRDLESGRLSLPDPDTEREMYDMIIRKAAEKGLHQYEISSFAKDNYECLHNIGYWTQVPYLGLGVSAASMNDIRISPEGMTYIRKVNPDNLDDYERTIISEKTDTLAEHIDPISARFETIMLGFRMIRGVSEMDFFRKHHVTMKKCWGDKLSDMEKSGLLLHEKGSWRMTARGFDIQNSVLVELMDS